MNELRLLYVTDLHGSSAVLIKAMAEAVKRRAQALIVCGDLEGKYLLLVEESDNCITWEDPISGVPRSGVREDLPAVLSHVASCGGYGVCVPKGWYSAHGDQQTLESILREQARLRIREWIARLDEFARETEIAVQVMPGNDDSWECDDAIRMARNVSFLDEELTEFQGYRFIGISRVPPTPWRTPRESSEKELARRLDRLASLGNPGLPLVLAAHTPPYASGLDNAPLLNADRKQVFLGGLMQTNAVGSTSLRAFLETRRDVPLALHGHVHESAGWARVGHTLCLNPGTEYFAATMVGFLVCLKDGQVEDFEGVRG
jgi:Icc-related predicted phosphoesterase